MSWIRNTDKIELSKNCISGRRAAGGHGPDRGRVHGAEHGAAVHRLPTRRPQEQSAQRGSAPDTPPRDESDGGSPGKSIAFFLPSSPSNFFPALPQIPYVGRMWCLEKVPLPLFQNRTMLVLRVIRIRFKRIQI